MVITVHVSVYNNFAVVGSDPWYRKLVHQCFRVNLISKKRKPALFFFSSAFPVIQKYSREDVEHLQVESTQGKVHLPLFFSFSFDYNPISFPWSGQTTCDISSRYQWKEPNCLHKNHHHSITIYIYINLYMEARSIRYLLWKKIEVNSICPTLDFILYYHQGLRL